MKASITVILAILAIFFLTSLVSASGPINFDYSGNLVVTYVSQSVPYNDEFGILSPVTKSLGQIHGTTPAEIGTQYADVGRCSAGSDSDVVLYFTTPEKQTYSSDKPAADGSNHISVKEQNDGSFTVSFASSTATAESDFNDVVLNVRCEADPTPVPEFPTFALPIGMIIGMLGGILFIRETREH